MGDIQILPASDNDKQWAAELMASTDPWVTLGRTLEQCNMVTLDTTNHVFIAWKENERAGMIILQDKGVAGSPYIKSIAIDATYRNRGIGKLLLQFAEDHYLSSSRHLFLCVSSFNTSAQKFYKLNGWETIGEFKDYVLEGFSEILMYKRLQ
jgi:[ribosomal protein S18]-alanine N-acetyltransferase